MQSGDEMLSFPEAQRLHSSSEDHWVFCQGHAGESGNNKIEDWVVALIAEGEVGVQNQGAGRAGFLETPVHGLCPLAMPSMAGHLHVPLASFL